MNLNKFKKFWEVYNCFVLIALILGILCFVFPWFRRSVFVFPETYYYEYLSLIDLFFLDLKTALLSLIYLLGFIFLILYYSGLILFNYGNFGTPMKKYSKLLFKLSIIVLIAYEILIYFHFINPPDLSYGWFHFFWDFVYFNDWRPYTGFVLEIIMVAMVIVSYAYDRLMLRRYYREYLPEYMPKSQDSADNAADEPVEKMEPG